MAKVYATPGVYIEEKSAFPNSAVPVATAVPAFIGYTEKAVQNKKDIKNVPTKISSFGEYLLYFGGAPKTTYNIAADADPNKIYSLAPADKPFLLYYCMKHFFASGGSDCYIVSIGDYSGSVAPGDFAGEPVVNGEIKPKGLSTLTKEPEPTMVVIPDAVRMPEADCYALYVQVLQHCGVTMRNRIAILDVHDGYKKRTSDKTLDVVEKFRSGVQNDHLQWGAAYYPWVETTITPAEELNFSNVANPPDLVSILTADVNGSDLDAARKTLLIEQFDKIPTAATALTSAADQAARATAAAEVQTLHQTLLAISPLYKAIMGSLRENINLLPPSAAMAGVYSMVDNAIGVYQSPANVGIGGVIRPAVNLTNKEQEDLNLPLNGKAINAIRFFPGKGPLVWGARTLDGNSQDWRYISVRRTVIFIEQSIKYASEPYVFQPNTSTTWINMRAMIVNFLTNVWQQGALAGATPEDAFSVDVGLGTTMTPVDILDGIMKITVRIAVTRPAEFIVLTFQQKMQQS